MIVKTKIFGEIEVDESRFIVFEDGILGFPDLKRFMLIHDEESGGTNLISWMQSIEEPAFAMPVLDPLKVCPDYNPEVEGKSMPIEIKVTKDNVCISNEQLHRGEFNVNPLHFTFAEEYTIDLVKKVVFTNQYGESYAETIINNIYANMLEPCALEGINITKRLKKYQN